jgi:hypothetical protein
MLRVDRADAPHAAHRDRGRSGILPPCRATCSIVPAEVRRSTAGARPRSERMAGVQGYQNLIVKQIRLSSPKNAQHKRLCANGSTVNMVKRRAKPTPPPMASLPKPAPGSALEPEPAPTRTLVDGNERQRDCRTFPCLRSDRVWMTRKASATGGFHQLIKSPAAA